MEILLEKHASDGQEGVATITESGTTTIVRIEVSPIAAQSQPAYIQMAPCSSIGPVEFNLNPLDSGVSETVLEMTFDELMTMALAPVSSTTTAVTAEGRWIIVMRAENAVWILTACGDLQENVPAGTLALATPTPVATPTPAATAAPAPAPTPTAATTAQTLEVTLSEQNASGQSGKATLTASGNQTVVTIDITPGPSGVAQPAHIHTGSCATLGDVVYPLNSVVDGRSTTTLDVSLSTVVSQTRALNVHKSQGESNVFIACGNLQAS